MSNFEAKKPIAGGFMGSGVKVRFNPVFGPSFRTMNGTMGPVWALILDWTTVSGPVLVRTSFTQRGANFDTTVRFHISTRLYISAEQCRCAHQDSAANLRCTHHETCQIPSGPLVWFALFGFAVSFLHNMHVSLTSCIATSYLSTWYNETPLADFPSWWI